MKLNPEVHQLQKDITSELSLDAASSSGADLSLKNYGRRKSGELSRKERRARDKKIKKAKRVAFALKKNADDFVAPLLGTKKVLEKAADAEFSEPSGKKGFSTILKTSPMGDAVAKYMKEAKRQERKNQRKLVEQEDAVVKQYEKRLNLHKRKSKTMPKSFELDGLGYLLEICDSFAPSSEIDESKSKKQRTDTSVVSDKGAAEASAQGSSQKEIDFPAGHDRACSTSDVIDEENEFSDSSKIEPGPKEDIYGRIIGDSSTLTSSKSKGPSNLAMETVSFESPEQKQRLQKSIKGLLNRLSESSALNIAGQIEELYRTFPRVAVKDTLSELLIRACVPMARLPDRFIYEHGYLIALLHSSASTEISAFLMERLSIQLLELRGNKDTLAADDKRVQNLISLLCSLFTLKVLTSKFIATVLQELNKDLTETEMELMLAILQNCGFGIRKEDPVSLKTILTDLNTQLQKMPLDAMGSRQRFLLDTLVAIKNNVSSKVSQVNADLQTHFVKLLRGNIKGGLESPLPMTLEDFKNLDTCGRWWIVGSSWNAAAAEPQRAKNVEKSPTISNGNTGLGSSFSAELLELAKKQRMNTDVRRTVFCIVMSAEDYLDAFEKLLKLGLKGQQEREIVQVPIHCCFMEKKYNPYYIVLLEKFCQFDRRFKLTVRFALFDKIRLLQSGNIPSKQKRNFACLLVSMIKSGTLSFDILKGIDLANPASPDVKLMKLVTASLLKDCSLEDWTAMVQPLLKAEKGDVLEFLDSYSVFLKHYFVSAMSEYIKDAHEANSMKSKIDFVNGIIAQRKSKRSF